MVVEDKKVMMIWKQDWREERRRPQLRNLLKYPTLRCSSAQSSCLKKQAVMGKDDLLFLWPVMPSACSDYTVHLPLACVCHTCFRSLLIMLCHICEPLYRLSSAPLTEKQAHQMLDRELDPALTKMVCVSGPSVSTPSYAWHSLSDIAIPSDSEEGC